MLARGRLGTNVVVFGQTTAGTEGTRAGTAHARLHAGKVQPSPHYIVLIVHETLANATRAAFVKDLSAELVPHLVISKVILYNKRIRSSVNRLKWSCK